MRAILCTKYFSASVHVSNGTERAGSRTLPGFPDACSAATELPPFSLQPVGPCRPVAARLCSLTPPQLGSQSRRWHLKCCLMSIVRMPSQQQSLVHCPLSLYLQGPPWLHRQRSELAAGVLELESCFPRREKRCRSRLHFGIVLGERHCVC